jgi:pantetheine-phosphate adenylyltransferase
MKKAMYALSGDPIHNGHLDIVSRATRVFDEVVVGIGANPDKQCLFSLEERLEMARRSLAQIPNAVVAAFEGLLVDYAYEQGIHAIVKGVRGSSDFDYENLLHRVGESQELGIDTFLLFARPELVHVSSTTIKALQKEEGFIHRYVPLYVKQCLEAKISGQYILGVTGEIGSGKSTVSEVFCEKGRRRDREVHTIELDHIANQILEERDEPSYQEVRSKVAEEFGQDVRDPNGSINRKRLGEIVYQDFQKLTRLNHILMQPLMVRLRKELRGKKGLILLNSALLAESSLAHLCNNHVLLVTCDKSSQEERLKERKLTKRQIQRRLYSQYSEAEKKETLRSVIQDAHQGKLWEVDSSDTSSQGSVEQVFEEIVQYLQVP